MAAEDHIKTSIDKFLKNSRALANMLSEITERAIQNTNIIQIDEINCLNMENEERAKFIFNELTRYGVPEDEKVRIVREMVPNYNEDLRSTHIDRRSLVDINQKAKDIKKIRLSDALSFLRSSERLSYELDIGGSKLPPIPEENQNELDRLATGIVNNTNRDNYRKKVIYLFAKHVYPYLDAIYQKDINFLITHLSELFQNPEFTSRISIIFGSRDENGVLSSPYLTEHELEIVWRIIHGNIKQGIYYCYSSNVTKFNIPERINGKIVKKEYIINYENLKTRWNLTYPE